MLRTRLWGAGSVLVLFAALQNFSAFLEVSIPGAGTSQRLLSKPVAPPGNFSGPNLFILAGFDDAMGTTKEASSASLR